MTFEQYLGEKKLKDSTRKKYLRQFNIGKWGETVRNHYKNYMRFLCPGMTPDQQKYYADEREFMQAAMNAIETEYITNLFTKGEAECSAIKHKRYEKVFKISSAKSNAYINGEAVSFDVREVFR